MPDRCTSARCQLDELTHRCFLIDAVTFGQDVMGSDHTVWLAKAL
jgi:hypothetical protein